MEEKKKFEESFLPLSLSRNWGDFDEEEKLIFGVLVFILGFGSSDRRMMRNTCEEFSWHVRVSIGSVRVRRF